MKNTTTTTAHARAARRAALRPPITATKNKLSQPANATSHKKGPGRCRLNGTVAEGAVVFTVRVVETGLIPGMRLAGEKVQVEAAGSPLQAKPTVEETSPTGLIVIVKVAVCPALMLALCGEAATVKSAGTETRTSSTSVVEVA